MKENMSAFKMLTGKLIGKRPLVRPRRRYEDNIRIYLKEIGMSTRNWVDATQDRDYRNLSECGIELSSSISHVVS